MNATRFWNYTQLGNQVLSCYHMWHTCIVFVILYETAKFGGIRDEWDDEYARK